MSRTRPIVPRESARLPIATGRARAPRSFQGRGHGAAPAPRSELAEAGDSFPVLLRQKQFRAGIGTAIILPLLAICSVSCGAKPDGGGEAAAPSASYEVRGEIARLPDPGSPEIWIRHESIPGFRNASGKVVGMASMTMPFAVAPGEPLDELAVGERIGFRLEIDWNAPGAAARVVGLHRLEPGTRLEFDPPAEGDTADADQGTEDAEAGPNPAADGATPR